MTMQQSTTRGQSGFQIGAFVALVLLVASDAGYRMASARLSADISAAPTSSKFFFGKSFEFALRPSSRW